MDNKCLLLAIMTSSLLVACGSSSSGDTKATVEPAKPPQSEQKADNEQTKPNKETESTVSGHRGLQMTTSLDGAGSSVKMYQSTEDTNKLIINGKTITLIPNGFSSGGLFTMWGSSINGETMNRSVSGTKFASRFGIIEDNGQIIAFSQGKVTDNMPTSGSAHYQGIFTGFNHMTKQPGKGNIDVNINFAEKTIKAISSEDSNGVAGVSLSGQYQGNTFAFSQGDISTKGQFYGDNAEEIGGTYVNKGIYTAAFGAQKQ